MPRKSTPTRDQDAAARRVTALQEDPLQGRFHMDIFTLNLIGETALGEKDEGIFTSAQLAETFHKHLERVFGNELFDSGSSRQNLIRVLELNLRTTSFAGNTSPHLLGYVCLGTVFLKRITQGHEVSFSIRRHPLLEQIFTH